MQENTTTDAQGIEFRLDILRLLQRRLREAVEDAQDTQLAAASVLSG